MNKKNTLTIKFNMDSGDYKKWRDGLVKSVESEHSITQGTFKSILKIASFVTSFQHIKRDYTEVEIRLSESDLLELVYNAIEK